MLCIPTKYIYFIWKRENGMDFVPQWHGKNGSASWDLSSKMSPNVFKCSIIPINIMFIDHEKNMDNKIISHRPYFLFSYTC